MYKFIKTKDKDNKFDATDIEMTVDDSAVTLPDILQEFKCFLLACGFGIDPCATLEVVEDNEHIEKDDYGEKDEGAD